MKLKKKIKMVQSKEKNWKMEFEKKKEKKGSTMWVNLETSKADSLSSLVLKLTRADLPPHDLVNLARKHDFVFEKISR